MKALFLDAYPDCHYRVCKDNNGGFGTANNYGDGLVARLLTWAVARSIDFPPLHVAYSMAEMAAAGHQVTYARRFAAEDAARFDVCVVASSIVAHESELAAVRAVSAAGLPVVVIGPFAGVRPDPYLEAGARLVLAGEPEFFFHGFRGDVAEMLDLGPVHQVQSAVPLDELAYPAWETIFAAVKPKVAFLGSKPTIPILSSRGCPFSCAHYCTYPLQQGRKLRLRSPANVVAEMVHWRRILGVENFLFRDPVFTTNRAHAEALCDAIAASGQSFRFGVELHLRSIDRELAERMYRAGLRMIYTGIESVSPEVIADAKRQSIAVDEQTEKVRMLEAIGIKVKAMYIFGFPADTPDSVARTIAYSRRLGSAFAQYSVFTPYPGTPIFEEMKQRVSVERYEDFTQWHLVFDHPAFSKADIRRLLSDAYRDYYTNPIWAFRFALSLLAAR